MDCSHHHCPPPPPPAAGVPGPPEEGGDAAQQSLVSALRSSFAILRLIMIVLVVLYLCSGVFQIQPGEQGVIARLGRLVENSETGKPVFTQGWIWWALPDPFDEKIRVSGSIHKLEIDTFLFQRASKDIENKTDIATVAMAGAELTPGRDGAMLTGDKNLSHGLWEVEYQITDAAKFVTTVGEKPVDFEPLLQRLFENSILREVSYHKVEDVTRWKIDSITSRVRMRLQGELDNLAVGVTVVKVNATTIVPAQVAPAFAQVANAENERTQQEHAARQRATEILNQAAGPQHGELLSRIREYGAAQLAEADNAQLEQLRADIDGVLEEAEGEVAIALRDARAEANTVREQVGREYEEYTNWLKQYREYPQATLIYLWTQMREDVLNSTSNEIFWVPNSDIIEILINRDPEKALEAETERLTKPLLQMP